MNLSLQLSRVKSPAAVSIAGSKSETNRLLLLQALFPEIALDNMSPAEDAKVMINALKTDLVSGAHPTEINIHHAGTAMRFLTAYFAMQEGSDVLLTGSARMQERPIRILVEALQELGADIQYEGASGFPPLRIKGKKLTGHQVTLQADVSSQYISALLLIAPAMEKGLQLTLTGAPTSIPYIKMTLALLEQIGVKTAFTKNQITVFPKKPQDNRQPITLTIESDWSSASYFYAIVALSDEGTQITLSSFKKNSRQGDRLLKDIYERFGVETTYSQNNIILRKMKRDLSFLSLHLNDTPDLAQTIAVTGFALGVGCHLTGLHTLKIKETDRLMALQNELTKLGAKVAITEDTITVEPADRIRENISIKTYNDHRMAMAFAPLALRVPLVIEEAEVVSKSYPDFWDDLKKIGFDIG